MSKNGLKRVVGGSSLERKIHVLFAIFFLVLITAAFLWVDSITEEIILKHTRDQAKGLVSDHLLRSHLGKLATNEWQNDPENGFSWVYQFIAKESPPVPYDVALVTLDRSISRNQLNPEVATQSDEKKLLQGLVKVARELQAEQNTIEAAKQNGPEAHRLAIERLREKYAQSPKLDPDDTEDRVDDFFKNRQRFYYYSPVIFKSGSQCLFCHHPNSPDDDARLQQMRAAITDEDPAKQMQLAEAYYNTAPPMFLRITLDNTAARQAITRSRAILISVAIIVAALGVSMLWAIVRYVIVKPLSHLRDVTEQISHGKTDVRAQIDMGDEFEELFRSFNRMLRHVLDTQNALQEANEVLDRKVIEQAQLNLKLHEMNQLKSEFMANMSHELRTPLNSIIGFSELLEGAKGLNDKQSKFAGNIRNSGRLLLDLINDILDLAKLEAGKMEVRSTEFEVQPMVSEMCDMVRGLAKKKNLRLECQAVGPEEPWPPLETDRIKLQQILTNLLSNAIKFTPEGGRIHVVTKRIELSSNNDETQSQPTPQLMLEVQDTGVGISPADQEIVFDKFRQGPSAIGDNALTREVSGTGLGLSIVKELCILLGGSIELESEVGRGSTFTVTIPWVYQAQHVVDSELTDELDKLNQSQRIDLARANLSPVPPGVTGAVDGIEASDSRDGA